MALFSVCSVYEGCTLVFLFYSFIYLFLRGVAFSIYGALGWDSCGVYRVSRFLLGIGVGRLWRFSAFMRHAGWSVYFIYLFIYLFIFFFYCVAWRGVAFRVAFMGHWGGALVASTAFVAFMRRLGWSPFCGI